MKRRAFTLAETLITLAVIGVVAAIVVPTLMHAMPSNNRVMFKKAYATLEQVVSSLSNDTTNYPSTAACKDTIGNIDVPRGFNYVCSPNAGNIDGTCKSNATGISGNNKFGYLFADQLNTVGTISTVATGSTGYYTFNTTDGIAWSIYIPVADTTNGARAHTNLSPPTDTSSEEFAMGPSYYTTKVIVDVNGTKNPNCTSDSGGGSYGVAICSGNDPDRFIFGVRYDGKIQIGTSAGADAIAEKYLSDPTKFTNN